ncbi:MAG: iron-containing redox enzyme family protein [Pyrinomonadaceae bacterium]|nr:iron-containing redox enzyme family protein [Pyrinomonadaceae bacterium]
MNLHTIIESKYDSQTTEFVATRRFQSLESGAVSSVDYDEFIVNICRTHLRSPQIVAFLFAVAPPAAAENLKENMLEEMGLDDAGVSHPTLLIELAAAIGFDEAGRKRLETAAQDELRRIITDPILFGTLKEVGLNVMLETVAFEWMLSRISSRIADFLSKHRNLSESSLEWFRHHSEVDIRHAEEGLQAVVDYINYYEIDAPDVETIIDVTFRENVFIKRYFGEIALAKQTGMAG